MSRVELGVLSGPKRASAPQTFTARICPLREDDGRGGRRPVQSALRVRDDLVRAQHCLRCARLRPLCPFTFSLLSLSLGKRSREKISTRRSLCYCYRRRATNL